jgi:RNA recognition motif-containing protein
VRKKKVQEDDGVEGLSPESVRKRKTCFGWEGFAQKGSQTLANGATSKKKKPKKISSEIDDMATNDNEREKNDHESGNTSMAAAENDGGETCDEVESRTIFVGNLPLSMTQKKLTFIFSKCGTVESTRVCVNKGLIDDSLKKTLQGYVVFADVSSVKAALELNNTIIPMEPKDGTDTSNTQLRMRVDTAKPTIDTARSVFVGNLPYSAQEGLLQEHFLTQLGDDSVEGVRIVRDRETMQCKGFGYVLLKTKALVAEALTKLPESIFMKRKLRVKACGKRFKGTAKRFAPIEGSTKDSRYFRPDAGHFI